MHSNNELEIFKSVYEKTEVWHEEIRMISARRSFGIVDNCNQSQDNYANIGKGGHYELP